MQGKGTTGVTVGKERVDDGGAAVSWDHSESLASLEGYSLPGDITPWPT